MGKRKYLIWGIFVLLLLLSIFIGAQKARAADSGDVVINEVMWMGSSTNWRDEWIELRNMADQEIDISNFQLTKKGSSGSEELMVTIPAGKLISPLGYFLISEYDKGHSAIDIDPDLIIGAGDTDNTIFALANTDLQIKLYKGDWTKAENLIDVADDGVGDPMAGDNISKASMERDDPPSDGLSAENWHTAVDSVGFKIGASEKGTPGSENSLIINNYPTVPVLATPLNNASLLKDDEVEFSWSPSIDPEGQEVSYEFYLGCSANLDMNNIIDSGFLETNYFLETNNILDDYGICDKYYWKIVASDGVFKTESGIAYSFTISEPFYSDAIIINELYPDPASGEEWIELYNNSSEMVDLKNWVLEDEGLKQYKILNSFPIQPFGFVTILHSDSTITLNNDGDLIKLFDPNNKLVFSTPKYSGGKKGWSFARNAAGTWQWTTETTPTAVNIIVAPIIEDSGDDDEENLDIPINSEPISIKTGEFRNFENYLVTITGTVIETSGNTFYLDDGSGKAKVYIQESKGIDKPPMHKGDIFQVIGIVNLYRQTWRILPQKQDDIKLIQAAEGASTGSSVIKKASAKSTSTKSPTTSATARSPTSTKKVGSIGDPSIQIEGIKTPWWIQIFKTLTGLAIIILVLIIIKTIRISKMNKPLGGNFGDET